MKKYRPVWLCEEDILNLKNAEKRLIYCDRLLKDNYEPIEIFTINSLIDQYDNSITDEKKLDIISNVECERIIGMSDHDVLEELIACGIEPEKSSNELRDLIKRSIKQFT